MYCVKCGVKLADTEVDCPLCRTRVYHPDIPREKGEPLYPSDKQPKRQANSKAFNGIILILFFIPMFITLLADWQSNGQLDWFGLALGGVVLGYILLALPLWFHRPNPVIFVPCDFAAVLVYVLYVNLETDGKWFMSFAFPVVGAMALIVCAVVALLRYVHGGRLYIWGGAFALTGTFILLVEWLLGCTFDVDFIGWSVYPMIVFVLLGGVLIYLAINRAARESVERKLFF